MRKLTILVASGFVLSALGGAAPAAAEVVGSASRATHRSCALTAATDPCGGENLMTQGIITQSYGGGIGAAGYNGVDIGGGNRAWSTSAFGADDLPVLRGYSASPGNVRMNINTFAFQSFTYTGAVDTPFALSGNLHIVNSSVSGPGGNFDLDGDGIAEPLDGGRYPNGAYATGYVGVWSLATIAGYTSATPVAQLFNALFYADCGVSGVLGYGITSNVLSGGEQNFGVATSACAPGSLNLTPGQEVLVVAGLQLPTNRGGFADATATFRTAFDRDQLSNAQVTNLRGNLVSALDEGAPLAIAQVPEPGTWTMLIAGFGLLGAAVRSRSQRLARG